ncbi:hypothetical protein [Spirosoma agri]|uniref:Uncharacterized protein n=1 Tax=Spirosoma agri TaxID=1987381 RepID=A0A6M0IQZ6_9BACT|nr:hypothetical protein [Spirosoma agri]NEU70327.1 hypothetical protein [Spirosoma agri]
MANRAWLGVEGEIHSLLTERREAGLFGRYYLWNGGFVGFTEVGLSYGRFQQRSIFADPPLDYPLYRTTKLSAAFGLAYLVGRRVSLEGVFKVGKASGTDWIQPSL